MPFARFFPDGMVPVIDYLHNLGIKFGLYTSVGDVTCHGGWSPGSLGHFKQDANTFAKWGVDYVKVDYCGKGDDPSGHQNLSKAMNATGRPMALELCRGPYQNEDHWGYAPEYAQGWRATGDHHDEFSSVIQQVNAVKGKGSWSGYAESRRAPPPKKKYARDHVFACVCVCVYAINLLFVLVLLFNLFFPPSFSKMS